MLLVAAIAQASVAQTTSFQTLGISNGRWWAALSEPQRLSYMSGLFDGLMLAMVQESSKPADQRYISNGFVCDCKIDDLTRYITEFYRADSLRQIITITAVLGYAVERAKGVPSEKVNQEAAELVRSVTTVSPQQNSFTQPTTPEPPPIKPIRIQQVVHFRAGEGYGCTGHLGNLCTSPEV